MEEHRVYVFVLNVNIDHGIVFPVLFFQNAVLLDFVSKHSLREA
jgi:hypothetical protein